MDKNEALAAIFEKHLGETSPTPTKAKIESALDVLSWLSQQPDVEGQTRDDIAHIRHLLDEL